MPTNTSKSETTSASPTAPLPTRSFAVEMIGTVPPPFGGVTIHCTRLLEWLRERGISACLWDLAQHDDAQRGVRPYTPALLRAALRRTTPTVVHWHKIPDRRTMFDFARAWYRRASGSRPHTTTVLSIHNSRLTAQVSAQPFWKRMAIRWFLRRCDAVIFDSVEGLKQGIALGCAPDRCTVIPAFIPPAPASVRPETLPAKLRAFVAAHEPVLSAVGWTIDFYDGVEIYGMDLLVEAIGQLVRTRPKIGLVFRLSQPNHPEYFATLTERVRALGIAENILWCTEPLESAAAIWNASDLFIRPTCTDGDAVSVGEALHLGVPVVASDAVARPARCRLFRNRDVNSLVTCITEALTTDSGGEFGTERSDGKRSPNHADEIIAVYRQALVRGLERNGDRLEHAGFSVVSQVTEESSDQTRTPCAPAQSTRFRLATIPDQNECNA